MYFQKNGLQITDPTQTILRAKLLRREVTTKKFNQPICSIEDLEEDETILSL